MKDNLDDTKPIKTLKEIEETRSKRHLEDDITEEIESRTQKLEKKQKEKETTDSEEAAEEALAEKNINEAEKLLKEEEPVVEEETKQNIFQKLKNKYNKLSKKGKIIFFTCLAIILILIIVLIIVLLPDKKKDPKQPTKVEDEVITEIVDNFYYKNGKIILLDETEKEIGEYECTNKDEKLCYVAINSNKDDFDVPRYLDSKGETKIQRIPIIDGDFVFIVDKKNEKEKTVNLYSLAEQKVIDTYYEVKHYADNYIIVKDVQSNYGLYQIEDGELKELIKPTYSYLGMIDFADNLVAKNSKGYIIVDKNNKVLSSPIATGTVSDYSNDLIVVKIDNKYNVYNYEAKILEVDHEFASVIDGYMALVDNKKLFVKDTELAKYTEEGVVLKTSDYVRTFIYDENGKIKTRKQSYTMEKGSDSITIAVYESEANDATYTNLEIAPVKINKKHKYVSYLDKKLYFYQDEQKESIIGSYSCGNKNFLGTVGEDFDACYVAEDTIFENNEMTSITGRHVIPIINYRFVFIHDGDSVYLYDLSDKKTMGTYASVNTYSDAADDATLVETTVRAVVKNKKGKFAMIQIGDSSASKIYNFEYNSMEKLGKYILAQKENNTWILLSEGGSSNEYADKIVAYNNNLNLFKGQNKDMYTVYDSSAKKLVNESFKYVELNNNYFVGVTSSNGLNIYDINGQKINKTTLQLSSTTDFEVSYSSGKYTVKIKNGDGYEEHIIDETTGEEPSKENEENNEEGE